MKRPTKWTFKDTIDFVQYIIMPIGVLSGLAVLGNEIIEFLSI